MAIVTRYLENKRSRVVLSAFLIASLLVSSGFFYIFHINEASAASITSASDTLSDPRPTATSNHSISFDTTTGVAAGETITVTFPSGFSTSSGLDFNDMDLSGSSAGEQTLADTASGATWGATTSGDVVVTFTSGSGTFAAAETITIEIGDNATAGATGDSYITNPTKSAAVGTADIYTVAIGGTQTDSGDILVAVVEGVTVSVTIDESLSFTIAGETLATCDTKFGTEESTGPTVTATSVAFGTATATEVFYHGCQLLTVTTNASSGYAVTGESDTSLKASGSGVLINSGTCDGSPNCTLTATDTWDTSTNNGWAYSATGTDSVIGDTDYRLFACTGAVTTNCLPSGSESAVNVMTASSPVSGSTSSIEYKLSISGTQAAGTYSAIVTYIATPTF